MTIAIFFARGWAKQYFDGQKSKEARQQKFNEGIKNKLNDFESSNKEVLAQNKKMVTQTREVLAQNREVLTDVMGCVRGVLNREEEWLNQSHTVHEHTRKIGTLEKKVEEVKSDIKQLKNTG